MAGTDSTESPLETVAGTTGSGLVDAFELLSNVTRVAILLALWEAEEPRLPIADAAKPTISFSALRDRVGMRDSGQFNYHLEKLVGTFVRQTETGYQLTESAEQILHAVFAGTVSDHESFQGEPIESDCYSCGEQAVVDYDDGILVKRCTSCTGRFRLPDQDREGVLGMDYRPPAGLVDRDPVEFFRYGRTWTRHRMNSTMEKVCPNCVGTVTTFFHERGLDIDATYDAGDTGAFWETIVDVSVTAEDPLEVTATIELAGDRLTVILDDEATVVDVTEEGEGECDSST